MVTQQITEMTLFEFFVSYFFVSILIAVALEGIKKFQKRHFGERLRDYIIFFCILLFIFIAYLYILGPTLREAALRKSL